MWRIGSITKIVSKCWTCLVSCVWYEGSVRSIISLRSSPTGDADAPASCTDDQSISGRCGLRMVPWTDQDGQFSPRVFLSQHQHFDFLLHSFHVLLPSTCLNVHLNISYAKTLKKAFLAERLNGGLPEALATVAPLFQGYDGVTVENLIEM